MKFTTNQRDLSKHINIAQRGMSSRTTMQILDGILIEAYKDKLKLTGTDLEISIETYLDCKTEREGSIVVNSKIFGDIIKKLPDSDIDIDVIDNNINIRCENSEFNIIGNPAREYPDLPIISEHTNFYIPADLFKSSIRQTAFATTQDETRPTLTGVLIEVMDNNISFVALDGYRLALRNLPIESEEGLKIIIPSRALNELNKTIEDDEKNIEISVTTGHAIFNLGDTTVYSRLLEGQFFNYKEIIRKDHKTSAIVNKREFQNSLERASLLAKEEKANLVRLSIIDDHIFIKSNSEIGNVNEKVDAKINGEEINIAFNSRYILEGIKIIENDEIRLNFMGSLNPCIINGLDDENYTYLVLPVRLAQEDF